MRPFCRLKGAVFGAMLGIKGVGIMVGKSEGEILGLLVLYRLLLDLLLPDFPVLDSPSYAFADSESPSDVFNRKASIALFIGNSALIGDNDMRENKH